MDGSGATLYDLMSYCKDPAAKAFEASHWISPRNWAHVLNALRSWRSKAAHASAKASTAAARQSAFAVGVVGPGGGQIERVVPPGGASAAVPAAPASPVRVRSFDAHGGELGEVGVELHPLIEHEGSPGASFVAPVPAGAAAVELVRDGQVLQRLERSAAPRVRVLSPRRGQRVRRGPGGALEGGRPRPRRALRHGRLLARRRAHVDQRVPGHQRRPRAHPGRARSPAAATRASASGSTTASTSRAPAPRSSASTARLRRRASSARSTASRCARAAAPC